MTTPQATTLLLRQLAEGRSEAGEELFSLLYGELHELARAYMAGERAQHTLQPTALIHEAWIRLLGASGEPWRDRSHLIGIAARAMRQVLIDHARKRNAAKRGSEGRRLPLDAALDLFEEGADDLLELDEALQRLSQIDPELVRIVELRFFGGASSAEIATALGVSTRTVERGWTTARAWLRAELEADEEA